jgi:hypothetical protein
LKGLFFIGRCLDGIHLLGIYILVLMRLWGFEIMEIWGGGSGGLVGVGFYGFYERFEGILRGIK